jgi:hypothetical protein
VQVQNEVTGLAYSLSPLVLFDIGARVTIPNVGLGFELGVSYVRVKYALDTMPAVEPRDPSGGFLGVAGAAFYVLELARFGDKQESRFYLAPLVGLKYESLSVADQEPIDIVLSSSRVEPNVGLRIGLGLDALALEANAKLGFIASYSESPDSTGDGGGGIGLELGATLRYWMSDNFALYLGAEYAYAQIGFDGVGTLIRFEDAPPLQNASLFVADFKTTIGAALAL